MITRSIFDFDICFFFMQIQDIMELITTNIQGEYRVDYLHFNKGLTEAVVLLHGFCQNAQKIYQMLGKDFPSNKQLIIPNGIFPMVSRMQNTSDMFFSWYFYNRENDDYYISYDIPAKVINNLLNELNVKDSIHFVGYSQGGYLAPFCGVLCDKTIQVICVNSSLRIEKLNALPVFPIHCLNGSKDAIVDPLLSKERFEYFQSKGLRGSFQLLSNSTHKIDGRLCSKVKSLLRKRP